MPPFIEKAGYLKDVLLIILLVFAVAVYGMGRYQRTKAQKELDQLSAHMEKLRGMELEFQDMSAKLVSLSFADED